MSLSKNEADYLMSVAYEVEQLTTLFLKLGEELNKALCTNTKPGKKLMKQLSLVSETFALFEEMK